MLSAAGRGKRGGKTAVGHQRRGHPGRGRRALQPGDDGSRGNGLYPLEAEVRAVSAEQRLRGLREPFMGGISGQKPKQTLPERTGYFLLMQHGDEVFLSQRPPVGLWGGLFCFPQFADEAELREWLAQRQIKADNLTQLTAFRHTFSHFHRILCRCGLQCTHLAHAWMKATHSGIT